VYCAQLTLLRSHRWYNSSQNFAIFLSKRSRESSIDRLVPVGMVSVNGLKDGQAGVIHTYRVSAASASSYARRRKSWRRSFQRILQYGSTRGRCLQIIATVAAWGAGTMVPLVLLLWGELANPFCGLRGEILPLLRRTSSMRSTKIRGWANSAAASVLVVDIWQASNRLFFHWEIRRKSMHNFY